MTGPKPRRERKRPRAPRHQDNRSRDMERGDGSYHSGSFARQQRITPDNDSVGRLAHLENLYQELNGQLDVMTAQRDSLIRKLDASDSASQRMAEKLMKKTYGSTDDQDEEQLMQLKNAMSANEKKNVRIRELEENLRQANMDIEKLEKKSV